MQGRIILKKGEGNSSHTFFGKLSFLVYSLMKNFIKNNKLFIILFLFILVIRGTNILTINYIDGTSMETTYHPNQIVIGSIIPKITNNISRGDIVIVKAENKLLIKRVIGLPNETIKIIDNKVYINNKEITEPYVSSLSDVDKIANIDEIILGDNEYYVMGDNRGNSYDSRYIGPINQNQIVSIILN